MTTANVCLSFTADAKHSDFDVDLAAFAYDSAGNFIGCAFDKFAIGNGIRHSGDTGNGNLPGIDEVLYIDYAQMPPNVHYILVAVALENPESQLKDFTELKVDVPEAGQSWNLLQCDPHARIFMPFVLQRNGTTAQFQMVPCGYMSPDAGLDYVWPLNEIALKALMPGAIWDQRVSKMPKGHKLKSGQSKILHHRDPVPVDGKAAESKCETVEKCKFYIATGWETNADLDSHVFGLDKNGKVIYHVYHAAKESPDGALKLDKDDLTGGGEAGDDDETVEVKTHKIDPRVCFIVFGLEIYSGAANFGDVGGEFIRVYRKTKVEKKGFFGSTKTKTKEVLCKYSLDSTTSFDKYNAGVFGVLRRVARSWEFQAMATPMMKSIGHDDLIRAIKNSQF